MGCSPAAIAWVGALLAAVPVSAVIAFNGSVGLASACCHGTWPFGLTFESVMTCTPSTASHPTCEMRPSSYAPHCALQTTVLLVASLKHPRKFGFQKTQKPETGYCLSNIQSVSGSIVNPLAKRRSTSSAAVRLAPRKRSGRCRSRCACRSTCTCPGDRRTRCSARPWPWPRTGRTVPCPHPC